MTGYQHNPKAEDGSPLICFCMNVSQQQIEAAVREHQAGTVDQVRALTYACSACASCRWSVEEVICDVEDAIAAESKTNDQSIPKSKD